MGVGALLAVMRAPQHALNSDVHKWAAGALHNLCANNAENRSAAVNDGAISLLRVSPFIIVIVSAKEALVD